MAPKLRPPGGSRTAWLAALAVVLAGALVYANSLHGPRLLDDQRTIVENTSIRQLSPLGAVLHPPKQMPVTGRPLANLSFAINYAVGETAVEGYHVWNIAVHMLAALALLGFLRVSFLRTGVGPAASQALALVCALVWVVHPLNSESVNYLTQRTESMMGLFSLAALYAAARAADGDGLRPVVRTTEGRLRFEVAAVVWAYAAVSCKETALTLPLLLVLWDRVFVYSSWPAAWTARRRIYGLMASSWIVFGYFARELPFFAPRGFEMAVSRSTYVLHQGPTIVHYLRLAFWPAGLIFDYGAPGPIAIADAWAACALVVTLGLASLIAIWRAPTWGYWGVWCFVTLAPASSLIPIPTEVAAERRMYLPLVGVVVLVALAAFEGLRRLSSDEAPRRTAWALAAFVTIALGATTVVRNRDYADGLRIWQTVLDRRPHARAHEHMAMALRDAGRLDESIEHLRVAAVESANALHALASARLERGDRAGALADYREFVTRYPKNRHIIEARETFAAALLEAGDASAAAEQFRAIIAVNPEYARARVGLASALSRAGETAGARAAYAEALRIQPQNLLALVNLGLLEAGAGEGDRAIETLRRALALQPAELTARRRLVSLFLERRQFADVEAEARALVQYAPSDSEAHNVLGVALASQQKFGPAKASFAEAVRLDPTNTRARQNLASLP